ncbi:cytochrome P450 7A1-like [Haliotis cracherodii]|uniref:cytochrome P450 7A1-like n=1 Tax=Haliotis cracherodii TaxID=6455 RepID=UPI0039EA72B7
MAALSVYLAALAVGLTAAYFKFLYRRRREGEPPLVPGNFLFGSGAEFAQHAVNFLHKCKKTYGDIFTIRLLNQHVTIVMDPHSYESLSKERRFDFDPIQRQVNHNVFSFELVDARKMLSEAGKKVNGRHLHCGMKNFSDNLQNAFDKVTNLDVNGNVMKTVGEQWGHDGLRSLTSKTIFAALFYTIFGHGESQAEFEPQMFHKSFDVFHKYFNYMWLGLPAKMFPKATKALQVLCQQPNSDDMLMREGVSEYIKFATGFMKDNAQSEQDIIGHNLVFLHVNYNTFRLAFWCIYKLLENKKAHTALAEEIREFVEEKRALTTGRKVEILMEEFDKLPLLDSFIKETLRITSGVFMVRYISEDTDFTLESGGTYTCRQGDRVAIYPPAIHMDPEIYEEPEEFKYDRFVDAKFYKNGKELKHPIIAFGSLCPGKKYSLLQTKWFMLNLINSFEMELLDGESTLPDVNFYGHEILPPVHDVQVRYRLLENSHELDLVSKRTC